MSSENGRRNFKTIVIIALVLPVFVTLTVECLKFYNIVLEEPDKFVFYWKVYLFSEKVKVPRKDIAIVYIDDRSLASYPYRSPIDRAFLASLVRDIDSFGPKAIGLDLVFDRPTEPDRDDALRRAINEAKAPIVMVGTGTAEAGVSKTAVDWQAQYLQKTKATIASPFLDSEITSLSLGDDVIRNMTEYDPEDKDAAPFALVLARQVKPVAYPQSRLIDWLLPSVDGREVFPTIVAPSYPRVDPKNADQHVLPAFMKVALAGKIVIVGGKISGSDWHRVPMTVATNHEVPGTYIHAQIVAQLLDGRTIAPVSEWISALIVFFTTFSIYIVRETVGKEHPEIFIEFSLIGLIIVFGSLMFWWFRINFPSAELGLMWLLISLSSIYIEKLVLFALQKFRLGFEEESTIGQQELKP